MRRKRGRIYPNGCHISEVEIDVETSEVVPVRHTAVDDVGHMINPLLVEGQRHGGIAQGVGQVLMENIAYDASDQLLSGSFLDYAMPRAGDFCAFTLGETRCQLRHRSASVVTGPVIDTDPFLGHFFLR